MVTRRIKNPLNEEFETLVAETLEKWHIPGMSIAIVDGENTWAQGYGIASYPSTPVTPSTLFYTGSTTKAFTAAAMAQVVADNDKFPEVQWDTPISQLIREDFVLNDEYATQHTTIEDALSHRTGLPRHDMAYGDRRKYVTPEAAVREAVRQLRHLPLTEQPRTKFQYCNLMYIAVSHLIETVTNTHLGDFLYQGIWKPLNMTSTYFNLEKAQEAEQDLAHGYAYNYTAEDDKNGKDDDKGFREIPWMELNEASGAGAIISNVLDYAKWARCLMYKENSPLSEESQKAIWEPRMLAPALDKAPFTGPVAYALGWWTGVYQGYQFFEHTGGMNAFSAEFILIPDLKYSVILFGNTAGTSNMAAKKLAFHLIDEKIGTPVEKRYDWDEDNMKKLKEEKDKTRRENAIRRFYPDLSLSDSPILPTARSLSAYVGTYSHPGYQTITLYLDKEKSSVNQTEEVLRADRDFTTWPEYLTFDHISGEYFLMRSEHDNDFGALGPAMYPAEFRFGVDGRPKELGIGWEEEMKGEKLWFTRVDEK